jgi:peptidoglycan-N-acetylmuramic acid deacetylase
MYDEGHIVGNQTDHHPDMTQLSASEVLEEMLAVEDGLRGNFPDAPDLLYFRPPEGAVDEWLLRTEAKLGYRTVLWSFAYNDWLEDAQPTYEEGIAAVKSGLHPGCVYLLHAESQTNADILAEFIDWVRSEGYEILPLCDITA